MGESPGVNGNTPGHAHWRASNDFVCEFLTHATSRITKHDDDVFQLSDIRDIRSCKLPFRVGIVLRLDRYLQIPRSLV